MRLKVSNVCQLLDKSKFPATTTINGVTFTNNGDGSITLNGTATGLCQYKITNSYKKLIGENTNKCLLVGSISVDSSTPYYLQLDFVEGNSWSRAALDFGKGTIFTNSDSSLQLLSIIVKSGVTVNNLTFKPQLFDLTEMYGAGNEPTTVAQFRQDFPNEMYEYSPECWKKFRRLKYIANKEPVQLLDKSKYPETQTKQGITYTNDGNGIITINGTNTASYLCVFVLNVMDGKPGHKYMQLGATDDEFWNRYGLECKWVDGDDVGHGFIMTNGIMSIPSDAIVRNIYVSVLVYQGYTVSNKTFKPQLFDLTEMYGAGNEPTTVAQFRQDFPNELYDYNLYNCLTLNRGKYIANKEPVQLLDKSKYSATQTINGVTFTNNGDGTFTVNGTATNNIYFNIQNNQFVCTPNKKYLLCGCPAIGSWTTFVLYVSQASDKGWLSDSADFGNGNVFTGVADTTRFGGVIIFIVKNQTVNNLVFKPQLYDLTEMFGAGHEPTTVAEFRQRFPNELYDYNPYNAITFR